MEKCYVVYAEIEDTYDKNVYIEGVSTDLSIAKGYFEKQCREYRENEMFNSTIYLTEWQGEECKTLEEYFVEELEEEEEDE